jgi:hypothetical protein
MKTVLLINGLLQELEDPRARERALHLVMVANEPQVSVHSRGNGSGLRIHDAGSSPE